MSKLIGNKFSSTVTSLTTSFTSSGTLTTSDHTTSAQYLVVGGGGAGGGGALGATGHFGSWCMGGGGGAGGFRTNVPGATSGRGASAEPSLPVSAATSYPIVVGAGGAGGTTYTMGHNGHGSSFGPDPDANTSLLVKSDTTDGSTTFTDSSSNAHSITVAGNTQHKTDQQRIGNSSMYFDGTGDYLEIADHTSLDLDGGDFTVECWFRCDDVDSPNLQSILAKWLTDSNCSYYLLIHPTAKLRWYVGNGSSSIDYVGNFDIVDKTWYHAALTKDGDVFTAYVDGTQDGSTLTFSTFADNNLTFRIGTDYTNVRPYKGYVDEVRISKGVERYTGNFDPTRADYITALGGGGSCSTSQAPAAPYSQPDPGGSPTLTKGQNGGSGGGGGFYNNPAPAPGARVGTGSTGQGYDGGTGSGGANVGDGGGGGGGAGAAGSNYSVAHGGAGQSSSISGSTVTYAGGGGGARSCHPQVGTTAAGDGGSGGGGNGGKGQDGPQPPSIPGSNQPTCRSAGTGTVNTGGGGGGNGGARYNGVHASVSDKTAPGGHLANAAAGGSGIVIVKEVVPGSVTTYSGSIWKAGGIWNAKDVYKERVKDNWK